MYARHKEGEIGERNIRELEKIACGMDKEENIAERRRIADERYKKNKILIDQRRY